MGYMGLRQPSIFKYVNTISSSTKYIKSKLSNKNSEEIKARLFVVMEKSKPYLDGGLTLPQLANSVGCTSNHLSQVINDELGKTFFDFINSHRIDQTKQQLLCPETEKTSILTILMDAGFNSKSAFYTAFKKEVGMTPSQYKKSTQSRIIN